MALSIAPNRRLVHDQSMAVEAIHLGAPRKPELWTVESVRAQQSSAAALPGACITLNAAVLVSTSS